MERGGGYQSREFVAEFYDATDPYRNRKDVQFFVDYAKQSNGQVLELGCGTGRVLMPIAEQGVPITGLDLSAFMLSHCRRKLEAADADVQGRVELIEGDMCDFDLNTRFKLITIPFRPFQHLETVEEQLACLRCAHRHLSDDGRFILDVFNPSPSALIRDTPFHPNEDEPPFNQPDGSVVQRKICVTRLDPVKQLSHVEMDFEVKAPDGSIEHRVWKFTMRWIFRYEAEHLLARCGFEIEEVFGDYDRSPFGSKAPGELIVVARKAKSAN